MTQFTRSYISYENNFDLINIFLIRNIGGKA